MNETGYNLKVTNSLSNLKNCQNFDRQMQKPYCRSTNKRLRSKLKVEDTVSTQFGI